MVCNIGFDDLAVDDRSVVKLIRIAPTSSAIDKNNLVR
jgi:hypothetical protein